MAIQVVLQLDLGEQRYAEDREQEQKEDKEGTDVNKFGDRQNERLENLLQVLGRLYQFEHPSDSERSDNRRNRANIDAEHVQKDDAEPGRDNDHEVKDTPTVLEVAFGVCNNLDDHLNRVNRCEAPIENLKDFDDVFRHAVPRQGKDDRIDANANEDEYFEC